MEAKIPTKISSKVSVSLILTVAYVIVVGFYISAAIIASANFISIGVLANSLNKLYNYVAYYLLMGVSIINVCLYTKWTRKKLYYLLLAGPVILLMYYMGNSSLLLPFVVILGYPHDLNLRQFAKAVFWVQVVSIILVLIGYLLGYFSDNSFIQHNVLRHSWGFISPNTLGNYIAIILGEYIFIYWKKWNLANTIVWITILLVMWNYQNSRAAFYYGILIILLTLLIKKNFLNQKLSNLVMWLPIILFTIGAAITFYAIIRFSKNQDNTYNLFNALFSGRLSFMIHFYNKYGLSWFGHTIDTVSIAMVKASNGFLSWMGVDSSYAYIALNDGFIGVIIYWLMFFFANLKVAKDKNWGGVFFLILMALMGLSENYLRLININFTFFIFASYIANARTVSVTAPDQGSSIDAEKTSSQ